MKFCQNRKEEPIFEILDKNKGSLSDMKEILTMLISETEKIDNIINQINSYSNKHHKYDAISKFVDKLISVQKIKFIVKENEESLRKQFVTEYHGIDTDWESVKKQLDWVSDYKVAVDDVVLTDKFNIDSCKNTDFQNECAELANKLKLCYCR